MTTARTIEAVWRIEQPRLTARMARHLRDVGLAEEVVQDAFAVALARWPEDGVPRKPAAWLTRVAKNRALDRLRRTTLIDGKRRELAADPAELERQSPDIEAAFDEDIDDGLLRLVFTACHPVLPAEQRAALALRLLGGLSTPEIAACHARAVEAADTDWIAIAAYYEALTLAAPSPIVDVNRAVAVGMASGPAQGLVIADALRDDPRLKDSHLLPTVRGDLLEKLGRVAEAQAAFRKAAELTGNDRERALLLARADRL